MERLSDRAIEILDNVGTDRLGYHSEYLPLIEAAHKLAEYEATGLEPSEIQWRKEDLHILDLFKDQSQDADEAIRIAEARRDARLVILPCKIGDVLDLRKRADIEADFGTVYHFDFWRNGTIDVWLEIDSETVCRVEPGDIGKNVFLTREEAEDALKQQEEAEK